MRLQTYHRFRGKFAKGTLVLGDALEFMQSLPKASASVIFIDPPFNLHKKYSKSQPLLDYRSDEEYYLWMKAVLSESIKVLKPGGTLYLYHIPLMAMRFGQVLDEELDFRHWIAISMKNGFPRGRRLYPAHYALLMFTKGPAEFFTRPKIDPKLCRHCHNLIKDYGGYRSIIEKKGINLSDFWEDLSPVRHANRKHREANELPEELYRRVFAISGAPDELYVDPFAGSGTGVLLAAQSGMRFAACDIVDSNCEIIRDRLEKFRHN
ncbi:MAG: site-specific DNA-methyltransferase [bacterium]|nr:site-specific DNA-methyltransferase [bacterium]